MSLVLDTSGQNHSYGALPPANVSSSMACPVCKTGTATGLYLLPLNFHDIERSIELRRKSISSDGNNNNFNEKMDVEATYLLHASNRSALASSGLSDRERQRTGRWTEEEIKLVDYLVTAFCQGKLPLPHGVKLNEFLGDFLICKSSRLTKKMKSAKLSTRSFALGRPQLYALPRSDHALLSILQEQFLMSIPSEPIKLELRFNMAKHWRTHFSNLCVQVGYPSLHAKEWAASLEEMERRASNAEDIVRKMRRRKISLSAEKDSESSAKPPAHNANNAISSVRMVTSNHPQVNVRKLSTSDSISAQTSNNEEDMFDMLDSITTNSKGNMRERLSRSFSEEFFQGQVPVSVEPENGRIRTFSEDFDAVLNELIDVEPGAVSTTSPALAPQKVERPHSTSTASSTCSPFLDAIIAYLENKSIPFQHVDVWVPSFLPREATGPCKAVDTEQLKLFHAGHATREDIDDSLACLLNEFGVQSDKFSFEPGQGLPGRVYSSGRVSWESLLKADQKSIERIGGMKVCGIKTAVGIPLNTPLVGRIVVVLYSCLQLKEDMTLAMACASEIAKYSPEPKWKVVIEMNDSQMYNASTKPSVMNQLPTQHVGCSSPTVSTTDTEPPDPETQKIITLLGEHMPIADRSAGESSSSAANSTNLLPHYMSMRLILLRSASRRTSQQNEMIDILKSSFRAYSKDNRRSGADLANLLAKDWICLKATFALTSTTSTIPIKQEVPSKGNASKRPRVNSYSVQGNMPSNKSFTGPMKPPTQAIGGISSSLAFMPPKTSMRNMPAPRNTARPNSSSLDGVVYTRNSIGNQQPIAPKANRSIPPKPVASATTGKGKT